MFVGPDQLKSLIEQRRSRLHLSSRAAPAVFIGMQEWPGFQPIPLYTLIEDIVGHPSGSTVSAKTLLEAGFDL